MKCCDLLFKLIKIITLFNFWPSSIYHVLQYWAAIRTFAKKTPDNYAWKQNQVQILLIKLMNKTTGTLQEAKIHLNFRLELWGKVNNIAFQTELQDSEQDKDFCIYFLNSRGPMFIPLPQITLMLIFLNHSSLKLLDPVTEFSHFPSFNHSSNPTPLWPTSARYASVTAFKHCFE